MIPAALIVAEPYSADARQIEAELVVQECRRPDDDPAHGAVGEKEHRAQHQRCGSLQNDTQRPSGWSPHPTKLRATRPAHRAAI